MIDTKTPSVEEFLRTPENDRCEYAHGEQWEKPPTHSTLYYKGASPRRWCNMERTVEMENCFQSGITASDLKTTREFTYQTSRSCALHDILNSRTTPIAHPM